MARRDKIEVCPGCSGTEEIMPSIDGFTFLLNYIDAEPVPCPVCHPEFWEKHPAQKREALESIGCLETKGN